MTELDLLEKKELDLGEYIDIANLPRKEVANPHNYTELEWIERKQHVDDMLTKHPTVERRWIEYSYDFIKNNSEEKVKEIIEKGLWDKPKKRDIQAVYKSVEVINPEDPEYISLLEKYKDAK